MKIDGSIEVDHCHCGQWMVVQLERHFVQCRFPEEDRLGRIHSTGLGRGLVYGCHPWRSMGKTGTEVNHPHQFCG